MSLLEIDSLSAFYGDFQALFDIDFKAEAGKATAIIGANGAGKSTFLRSVSGFQSPPPNAIRFDGEAIGGLMPSRVVSKGVALVPEGRRLFPSSQRRGKPQDRRVLRPAGRLDAQTGLRTVSYP